MTERTPKSRAEHNLDAPIRRVRSEELFGAGRLVVIVHRGREYTLRITAADKLILNA